MRPTGTRRRPPDRVACRDAIAESRLLRGTCRRFGSALYALLAVAGLLLTDVARAGDPYLRWYTVETPHFRVHFHSGLEEAAQRTANLAEDVRRRLVAQLAWSPPDVIHIALTDSQDSANGSAQVLPYNLIRMFMTAPDDMSALGEYDDWLLFLLTHEHTHVVHLDNVSGIPALLNAIFGKTYAPNHVQPKWIVEGLAVALETEHTGGGRLRSSMFDMYLRADVLEDNIATLDQISHSPDRWPSGTLWYLYGGKFVGWILDVYGHDTFAAVATDYGQNPLAWGINRSIRRATGRTYEELYAAWIAHLRQHYAAQVAAVRRRGLRTGTRLTFGGRVAANPRIIPRCARLGAEEEVLYYRADGHARGGLYRVRLSSPNRVLGKPELVARTGGHTGTFDAQCGLVFENDLPTRRQYRFNDLLRLPPGMRSPLGIEGYRRQLTFSRRAREPDISRDGTRVTYVTNHAGTTTLRIARLTAEHRIEDERALVPSARYEQAFTPRFSPDGRRVAYATWTRGGYRDIRVVDVGSGSFRQLTHDRATDQQPSWTPDGKTVLFASDRSGIPNIYAYELATGRLWQVTNVLTGAYMPQVSTDGHTLYYIGYTSAGFDLYSMPLDRTQWLSPPPPPPARPDPPPERPSRTYPVVAYSPWATLRPHSYSLEYGPGTWGQTLLVSTQGTDAVEHHSFAASLAVEAEQGEPAVTLDYGYHRLPCSLNVGVYRRSVPRSSFRYGDENPIITEHVTGITTGVGVPLPDEYESQQVTLRYSALHFDAELPLRSDVDPYSLIIQEPHRGFYGGVRATYSYDSSSGSEYSMGRDRGLRANLSAEIAGPELASDWTLAAFSGHLRGYVPLPWGYHHSLALAASGGISGGSYSRQGLYYTGGFVESSLVESFQSEVTQSAFVLRGYEPAQYSGRQYQLFNVEYRLPLFYVDRGVSTLPVFLHRISMAAFADYGGAYDTMDLDHPLDSYQLGVGAEVWVSVVLGYYVSGLVRVGHARGTDSDASRSGQTYVTVASSF